MSNLRLKQMKCHTRNTLYAWVLKQAETRPYWSKPWTESIWQDLKTDQTLRSLMEAKFQFMYPEMTKQQAKRWSMSFIWYPNYIHGKRPELRND